MRTSFSCIDTIGKGKHIFHIRIIILERHFYHAFFLLAADIDGLLMKRFLISVYIFNKRKYAALIEKLIFFICPFILKNNLYSLV